MFLCIDFRLIQQIAVCAGVASLSVLCWWLLAYLTSPLRRYPGPFLAGFTNIWRFLLVRSGKYPFVIRKLHERYGPVLRIGPNLLDLDFPELLKTIYGTNNKFLKTPFYHNNSAKVNGQLLMNMFATADVAEHQAFKRPVAKHYSLGASLSLEPLMDSPIENLCQQLSARFAGGHRSFDLSDWIKFCTWDVVGATNFSKDFDFLSTGCDYDNSLANSAAVNDYFAIVGQMPFLDNLLDKNPIVRIGPRKFENVVVTTSGHMAARKQGLDKNLNPSQPDYLQLLLDSQAESPDTVTDGIIVTIIIGNLVAGADTTAIAINSALYFAIRDRRIRQKLSDEIFSAGLDGQGVVSYSKVRGLPYLGAVFSESSRLWPILPMILERFLPTEGLSLPDGTIIPGGTAVGLNPYIINRNVYFWGNDAEEFIPERWLPGLGETEDSESYKARVPRYKAADLQFGGGTRICLGRQFAIVEMYKIVATLVRRFDIELEDSEREWDTVGIWFARQSNIIRRIRERSS